jgi:hypothetical protein
MPVQRLADQPRQPDPGKKHQQSSGTLISIDGLHTR